MKRCIGLVLLLMAVQGITAFSQEKEQLTLLFMGDIMQHGQQVTAALDKKTGTYNYHPNYQYVKHIIQSADLAIANLELTLAGPPYTGYPQFSAPDALAVALKAAGVDFLVTANNHSLDRHSKGVIRTIDVLDDLSIPHTGTFKDSLSKAETYPYFIEKNNFKIAVLNYTYGTNGIKVRPPIIVNYIDDKAIVADIEKAKLGEPDAIIVFTHWGYEYRNLPNQDQKRLADLCIENGVQLVIGSHPHVVQPIELRSENALVAYSLGNYISNMRKRNQDGGIMLEVKLSKDSTGTSIEKAGYYLSWVYKTPAPNSQFHILPTLSYTQDTTIVRESSSRLAMNTFVQDSRELFSSHNLRIGEIRNFPELSSASFSFGLGGEKIPIVPKKEQVIARKEVQPETILSKEPEKRASAKVVQVKEPLKKAEPKQKSPPIDLYRVQILVSSVNVRPENIPDRYEKMIFVENTVKGLYKFQVGEWATRKEAEEVLSTMRSIPGFEDAFIVTRKSSTN